MPLDAFRCSTSLILTLLNMIMLMQCFSVVYGWHKLWGHHRSFHRLEIVCWLRSRLATILIKILFAVLVALRIHIPLSVIIFTIISKSTSACDGTAEKCIWQIEHPPIRHNILLVLWIRSGSGTEMMNVDCTLCAILNMTATSIYWKTKQTDIAPPTIASGKPFFSLVKYSLDAAWDRWEVQSTKIRNRKKKTIRFRLM